ncbi:glycosyltransferase family 4 protein, partial [Candidatus Dojkabacteria bacterium]|nr:glycosyltransferase family 4 protein [Candidatus Dojkabacteria bacterium]
MRIGIDITPVQDQYKHRGIGRVAYSITQELINREDTEIVLFGFEEDVPEFKGKFEFISINKKIILSKPFNPLYWQTKFKGPITNANLDYYLSYNFERGLPTGLVKTAVFIHDVIPYTTKKYSQKSFIHNLVKGIFYEYALNNSKNADLILTNSKFSKEELVNTGQFDREKIHVTYLGIGDRFRASYTAEEIQSALNKYGVKFPYILYYGGFEPNKNVLTLIKAWELFLQRNPGVDIKLAIGGRKRTLRKFIENQGLNFEQDFPNITQSNGIHALGYLEESDLPLVLKGASIFIHLSKYEGFGFSLAEAITMRVPIVASNASVYPEIVKDTSLLVDPENIEAIADMINKQ